MNEKQQANKIQNDKLAEAYDNNTETTIILVNGVQLKGKIKAFDKFTICLITNNGENLVFKHAVSTIII